MVAFHYYGDELKGKQFKMIVWPSFPSKTNSSAFRDTCCEKARESTRKKMLEALS